MLQSCELIPHFLKRYPILYTLWLLSYLGSNERLHGQTRAQRQGDFSYQEKKIFNENGMESLVVVQAKWENFVSIYKQGWKSMHKK